MNKIFLVLFVMPLLLAQTTVQAFERIEISFTPFGRKGIDDVKVTFVGKKFNPALDVLKDESVKDADIKKIQTFFQKLYQSNLTGTRESILSIWAPSERSGVSKQMNPEVLAQNKSRFSAMASLKLDSVIKYGDYYVALLQTEFGSQYYPIKFTLKSVEGSLYLTNELNGDNFYDNVIHFLDYRRGDSKK